MSARRYRVPPDLAASVRVRIGSVPDAALAEELGVHPETVRRWRLALKIAPCRRHRRGRAPRTSAGRWAAQHDRAFTLAEFGEGARLSDAAAAHRLAYDGRRARRTRTDSIVSAYLAAQYEPKSTGEIVGATGLFIETVRNSLFRVAVCVGRNCVAKLWVLA